MSRPGDALDALRGLAALAVVCLHAAALTLGGAPPPDAVTWWAANLLDAAMRWCVPVFVMISGALLLGREEPPGVLLRRRLLRLLPLLVVWSVFYAGLQALTQPDWSLADAMWSLLRGTPYYHLWYLFMLPGLYLLTPILQRFLRATALRRQMWLLFAALSCMLAAWWLPPAVSACLRAPAFLAAYVAGFLLHKACLQGDWPARLPLGIFGGLYLVSSLGIAWMAALPSLFGQSGLVVAYDYANPLVLLQACAVFSSGLRLRSHHWQKIGALSLGIYLLHPAMLLWLHQLPVLQGAGGMLPLALLASAFSAALTALLLRLPGSRYWLR